MSEARSGEPELQEAERVFRDQLEALARPGGHVLCDLIERALVADPERFGLGRNG